MGAKALLVDFGGVLTTSIFDSFAVFCRDEGIDADAFRRVLLSQAAASDSPFARMETGAMSAEEFDRGIAKAIREMTGVEVAPEGLKQRLFAAAKPDERMIAAVGAAREAGIVTVLLSNSWGDDYPRSVLDPIFDEQVISGRVGLRKPAPEIYRLAADRAGVPCDSCVFVDDLPQNVDGARAVGMEAIRHRNAAETIPALEAILGVTLER